MINKEKLKLNGFLKHLLLDNLAADVASMMSVYSDFGIDPACINPYFFDEEHGREIKNIYNFDEDTFPKYKECLKEEIKKGAELLEEQAKCLSDITDVNMTINKGINHTIDIIEEGEDRCKKFWTSKAMEELKKREQENETDSIRYDIEMVQNSNIEEPIKDKIIEQIKKYDADRRNNYEILKGVRRITSE